ncbi:hypothetical protein [Methylocaldum gracile]
MIIFYLVIAIIISFALFGCVFFSGKIARFYFIGIIALLGYIVSLENRAAYCGLTWSYSPVPALPYGVKPDWENGVIWLVDSDGFGLLTPYLGLSPRDPRLPSPSEYKLKTLNGEEVRVNRILAYSYDPARVYVKVATSHPSVEYAIIDQPNPTRNKIRLFSESELTEYLDGFFPNDISWIFVGTKDCGSVNFQRFIAYFAVVAFGLYGLQTIRPKTKNTAPKNDRMP